MDRGGSGGGGLETKKKANEKGTKEDKQTGKNEIKNNTHSKHNREQDNTRSKHDKTKQKQKQLQIITISTFNLNKQIYHFKTTFHNLNTLPTYKYIHFKTTFMCPRSIAGVPLSQALPSFLITPPSLLVPAVLGALAVWIQNRGKKTGILTVTIESEVCLAF